MKVTRKNPRGSAKKKIRLQLIITAALLAAMVIGIYVAGQTLEHTGNQEAVGSLEGRFPQKKAVAYKDREYVRNDSIETFLIMGIDHSGATAQKDGFRNGGQCDFLTLLVIDAEKRKITPIQIDRDTMAEITVLGILGNDLGTNTHQICLAHGFGDGEAQSCEFTREAVKRLLLGTEIDGYYALNLDGIETLNELLGGVVVTLEDDFSMLDPEMTQGKTITLRAKQAEYFVRSRMTIGDGTNASRMRRQQQFLVNAIGMVAQKVQQSGDFIGELFDGLDPYTITDISRGRMINAANKAGKYQIEAIRSLQGEHSSGQDGFVEFHVDEEALTELVLEIFYTPAD